MYDYALGTITMETYMIKKNTDHVAQFLWHRPDPSFSPGVMYDLCNRNYHHENTQDSQNTVHAAQTQPSCPGHYFWL